MYIMYTYVYVCILYMYMYIIFSILNVYYGFFSVILVVILLYIIF